MNTQENNNLRVVETVVQYRRMIQAYSNAIVRDFHLAEDVYQEVAMIVAKNWETLPPDEELLPWIREITRRKSLEAVRKNKRMPLLLTEETLTALAEKFTEEEDNTTATQLKDFQQHLIEKCVSHLKGMAKAVIEMRYGRDDYPSCEEIADELGRSVKAVYNIIGRARLALVQCVEKEKMRYVD